MNKINLQEMTDLPLKEIVVITSSNNKILVQTPHKGEVELKLTDIHYPFLFGSVTQTERDLGEIIGQIRILENESYKFLIKKWKENL